MDMESEEIMWKTIYDKLQKQKSVEPNTEHELRIQEIDGAFFEKFGNLFRESAEQAEHLENEEEKKVAEFAAKINSDEVIEEEEEVETVNENEEVKISDSESEEKEEDKSDFISVAFNIDELYTEVLYEILHNVGCDVNCEIGQTALISYAQDVFKVANVKHQELLTLAEKKEAPEILINVEVIEAKDLRPKDSNGLSDPFVTLYLASNTAHRYTTSVKPATLSPVWEEHFALPVTENCSDDFLCVEVWDFDPAETVREKFGKFFDVKGVKGMRKLVKEIAIAAATGQHENELIGVAKIPLNTVPASGMTMWYSLDKKNKINRQGVVKLRISFSSEKNTKVAEQEHRHMLRMILLHELEVSKVAPYWWCGTFSPQGEALLTQHIAQSGLTPIEVALCQWSVYCCVHQSHPFSFGLFTNLLEKIYKSVQSNAICEEDTKLFWDGARRLLPSCFGLVRKLRKRDFKEKTTMEQLGQVLDIVGKIGNLTIPEQFDLFPANSYPWLSFHEHKCQILTVMEDAVKQGADDWFNHILQNNDSVANLQNLIQAIQLVRSDIQKALEFYDKIFQETVNFSYAKTLYVFYQARISAMAEPEIRERCKGLKKLSFSGLTISDGVDSEEMLKDGTTLFELYLALYRFVMLGHGLCPADCDTFHVKNFYQWFHGGVAQWLDIAVFKALQRIDKAVELDKLVPVDATVKYSSSAVDTLTIFYQVKVFWQQLNWPDIEGCYTFIAKIIDDICRCCVFYAEKMATKLDAMAAKTSAISQQKFEVTNEWCMAINNIEYVRQSLQPFTEDLGMKQVLEKIGEMKSVLEANRCKDTLNNVIANAIDTVRNEIIQLLEKVVQKMAPAMKRLLIEGAELFNQDSNSVDRLMMYVDGNLRTLHNELNEENFNRVLEIVWDNLDGILKEIIQSNVEKRRPPSFFANLHKTLDLMVGSFKISTENGNCDQLQRTERMLKYNGMETCDLIHQVHLDLYEEFKIVKESRFGELTVRVKFEEQSLKVEVMNARNLIAMDSNGASDAFVRIHLLPEHKFMGVTKPKTQTQYKTLFPLFDETFVIALPSDYKDVDGLVLFSVKDKDYLGYNNQYIGEALMHFNDISETSTPLNELNQVYLPLCRPTSLNSDAIAALEHRQGDKQAKEFLRKLKQRMGTP